jgi:hypothetical protein
LPRLFKIAEDIWEIQELIRMTNLFIKYSIISGDMGDKLCESNQLLIEFDHPLDLNYNSFWRQAENLRKKNT